MMNIDKEKFFPVIVVMVKISEGTVVAATSWSMIHSRHTHIPFANLHARARAPGRTHTCRPTKIVSARGQKSCSVRLTGIEQKRAHLVRCIARELELVRDARHVARNSRKPRDRIGWIVHRWVGVGIVDVHW